MLNDIAFRRSLPEATEGLALTHPQGDDIAEEAKQLKAAKDAYDRFAKAKAFWKT